MLVRDADATADAAACAAIYAPFVTGSATSFEEQAPAADALSQRIARTTQSFPWLVAETDGGALAGFAYAAPHRARAAYRWSTETSVYVDPAFHRQGVGRRLYETLLSLLTRQGLTLALAGITLPNDPSVALHEALDFTPLAVYRRIGFKAGAWRDVGWWERPLAELPEGAGPPPEPGPPIRLTT